MGTGYNQNLDLLNTSSYDEIIQIVKRNQTIPEGEWISEDGIR